MLQRPMTGSYASLRTFALSFFFLFACVEGVAAQWFRVACDFYDKKKPAHGMSPYRPGPPTVWARGDHGEKIFVAGELRDGFLLPESMFAKIPRSGFRPNVTQYENSYELAERFCQNALENAFPNSYGQKQIMKIVSKTSRHSSKSIPIVFKISDKATSSIDRIVIFSDSVSDQGNLKEALRVFPGEPYFRGRFSNGPNWVDYLQKQMGIAVQNWAVGGSVSGSISLPSYSGMKNRIKHRVGTMASGNLEKEINRYKKTVLDSSIKDADKTLFTVWMGSNDYIYLIEKDNDVDIFLDHPQNEDVGSDAVIDRVTDNVIKNLLTLYQLGARNFIVPDIPNIGHMPRILQNQTYHKNSDEPLEERLYHLSVKMSAVSDRHNQQLREKVMQFQKEHRESVVLFLDVAQGISNVSNSISLEDASHYDYGLEPDRMQTLSYQGHQVHVNKACYRPKGLLRMGNDVCNDPDRHMFWDDVHPTTFGHCLVAFSLHKVAAQNKLLPEITMDDYLQLFWSSRR